MYTHRNTHMHTHTHTVAVPSASFMKVLASYIYLQLLCLGSSVFDFFGNMFPGTIGLDGEISWEPLASLTGEGGGEIS